MRWMTLLVNYPDFGKEWFDMIGGLLSVDPGAIQIGIGNTPKLLEIWEQNSDFSQGVQPDFANGKITILQAGVYSGGFQISFSGSANTTFEFHLRRNQVEQPDGCHRKLTGGDVGSASFMFTPRQYEVGDEIEIYVDSPDNTSADITVLDAQVLLFGRKY